MIIVCQNSNGTFFWYSEQIIAFLDALANNTVELGQLWTLKNPIFANTYVGVSDLTFPLRYLSDSLGRCLIRCLPDL